MLKILISKEIQDSLVSVRFVLTLVLCAIMVLLAVWTGAEGYRRSLENHFVTESLNNQALEEQPDYSSLGSQGVKISMEPEVLQSLVSGVKNIVGTVASVSSWRGTDFPGSKSDNRPLFAVFGEFDLTFVVSVFFSLLALLYSYNAVTREKENGTLKLISANPLSRSTVILGKYLGNLISLLLPILIPLFIGLIILATYPEIAFGQEHWLRIGLLVLLYLLYLTSFFTLGILSSALVSRSSISLLIALLVWVVFIALIPRVSVLFADMILPVPTQSELAFQKEQVQREIEDKLNQQFDFDDFIKEHRDLYRSDRQAWQEKWTKFFEEKSRERRIKQDELFGLIEADFETKKLSQVKLAANLARLSPTSALMLGSMNLGRTGPMEHDRFIQSVKRYQSEFAEWISTQQMKAIASASNPSELPKPNLSSMPRHTFTRETLAESFYRTVPDFLVLVLVNVVLFTGAYVAFLRYDVR